MIELLVALVVAGIVVMAAHRVFAAVIDGLERTAEARTAWDREANARRLLAVLASSIETGRAAGDGFQGEPSRVAFTAWHRDAWGRAVQGRIAIAVENDALVLRGVGPEPVSLMNEVTGLSLDYLLEAGATERFVQEWRSDASAPLAIRLRIVRAAVTDTLLLIVGERG
jgi:hypothetical protein